MDKIIYDIKSQQQSAQIGRKADGLIWLCQNNFPIPKTYVAKAIPIEKYTESYYEKFCDELQNIFKNDCAVALRSSGINEDGNRESHAGNYKTFLNLIPSHKNEICNSLKKIVSDAFSKKDKVGIVIQEMIQAEYSGVLFSSNPNTFSKKEMLFSYRMGIGDKLVSGFSSDNKDVKIDKTYPHLTFEDEIIEKTFDNLFQIGIEIERLKNYPIDIEWVIEKETHNIYLLQCRPITTILLEKNEIKKISLDSVGDDARLKALDKVKIRLEAEKKDIMISDAYIVNCNCCTDVFPLAIDKINLEKSRFCKGYNIVVITPKLIDGKVLRHFVGKKRDAMNCITCNRYSFRAFPKYENIYEAVACIYEQIRDETWICTMIIQEIFDPLFTGIMKKKNITTFIELARGHFVAKGIVPMSRYSLENDKIVSKKEIEQDKYYRILEGHQIEQHIDKQVTKIDENVLIDINNQFAQICEKKNCYLEFGVLEIDQDFYPYLIDFTIENTEETLESKDIELGIISNGSITGRLIKIELQDINTSFNAHCKNEIIRKEEEFEPVIYLADLPSIELIEKLERKNIGFIFKGGSMLCHLAILLRENSIPAIIKDVDNLEVGCIYQIDTYKNPMVKKVEK